MKEARMSVESHLAELERRHLALKKELEDAMSHPGTDDIHLSDLKRRKLLVKDQIARLKTVETVH
jgi:hypothetical protein